MEECEHSWRPALLEGDKPGKFCRLCASLEGISSSEFERLFGRPFLTQSSLPPMSLRISDKAEPVSG